MTPFEPWEPRMQRLSAAYFFMLSAQLEPIKALTPQTKLVEAYFPMFTAREALNGVLAQTILQLRTSWDPCVDLRNELTKTINHALAKSGGVEEPIGHAITDIKARYEFFRSSFLSEMRVADFYAVLPKGAYDTTKLAETGLAAFHPDLASKIPSAIYDANQAGRCIAFDLPTAAAFHLHRVNEEVMRCYYDAVTGGKPRPEHRNIGAYIDAMKRDHVQVRLPSAKGVYSVLAMIKDHHRNPILHPDDKLEDIEEAISLLGIIRTALKAMLEQINPPPLELTPPEGRLVPSPEPTPALEAPKKTGATNGNEEETRA